MTINEVIELEKKRLEGGVYNLKEPQPCFSCGDPCETLHPTYGCFDCHIKYTTGEFTQRVSDTSRWDDIITCDCGAGRFSDVKCQNCDDD